MIHVDIHLAEDIVVVVLEYFVMVIAVVDMPVLFLMVVVKIYIV